MTTSREIPVPRGAGWPGPKPFVHLAQHLAWRSRASHGACTAFARHLHGLHGVSTLCVGPCTVPLAPPAQQLVATGSPNPAGAGGRGRAGRGRLHCFFSVSSLLNPARCCSDTKGHFKKASNKTFHPLMPRSPLGRVLAPWLGALTAPEQVAAGLSAQGSPSRRWEG